MNNQSFNIFNENQIQTIKEIIIKGHWGSTDIKFGKNAETTEAEGFLTKINKTKEHSGTVSGIAKTIKSSKTTAFANCSNWWGDGSGGMMFFNLEQLDCTFGELLTWAKN